MIGVVVPAFNCANSAKRLVQEIQELDFGPIYLIDDASDEHIRVPNHSGEGLHLIRNEENLGYSGSVLKGINLALAAGCSAIATIDGDAAHRTEDLSVLAKSWVAEPDALLIGDRMASKSFLQLPTKMLANQVSSSLVSLCFGGNTTQNRDVSSGLRVYHKDFAQSLIDRQVERFGLCYSSIFWSLKSEFAMRWVPIEVNYSPIEFQFTKQEEFCDLLAQLEVMNTLNFDLSKLSKLVRSNMNFNILLGEKSVFALFVSPYKGYIFREIELSEFGCETVDLRRRSNYDL